jgi:hypothetical protein
LEKPFTTPYAGEACTQTAAARTGEINLGLVIAIEKRESMLVTMATELLESVFRDT